MGKKNESMDLCLSDLLEQAIEEDYKEDSEETHKAVIDLLQRLADEGEMVLVPVRPRPEDGEEAPELAIPDMPELCKLVLRNNKDELFLAAHTSQETIDSDGVVTVAYSFADLLRDTYGNSRFEGMLLNPGTHQIRLHRKLLARLLGEPYKDDLKEGEMLLSPKAVIDGGAFLKEWAKGWKDEDNPTEFWWLDSTPILADGTVLLVYKMQELLFYGDAASPGVVTYRYRVLHYSLKGKEPKLLGKYRFSVSDWDDIHIYLQGDTVKGCGEQHLHHAGGVRNLWPSSCSWTKTDGELFGVGDHVRMALARSDGTLCVGYERNQVSKYKMPVCIYDGDGCLVDGVENDAALFCSAMNLDSEEELWYHLHPGNTICRIHDGETVHYGVQLQNFDDFCFTDDRKKLFVGFEETDCEGVYFAMDLYHGEYVNPRRVRLEMPGADTENPKKADVLGDIYSMKNMLVARCNNKLYFYDVNDLKEQ